MAKKTILSPIKTIAIELAACGKIDIQDVEDEYIKQLTEQGKTINKSGLGGPIHSALYSLTQLGLLEYKKQGGGHWVITPSGYATNSRIYYRKRHEKIIRADKNPKRVHKGYSIESSDWKAQYEMLLPDGKTCKSCMHCNKCVTMFGQKEDATRCQFHPTRYQY